MSRIISSSEPVARKNYGCDACIWISESDLYRDPWFMADLNFAEKRAIAKAHLNGWRIMKGEKHLQSTIVSCDGDLVSWRAIPEIHAICEKYELYEYDNVC
jgi:hypothetical protein